MASPGPITCRTLRPEEEAAYAALLASDPGNLIYASPPFLQFLRHVTGAQVEVLVAERDGTLLGALPFAVSEEPGLGCVMNSLPWWGSHGSILLRRRAPEAVPVRAALLDGWNAEVARRRPLSATLILLPEEEAARDAYIAALRPGLVDGRIGQITDLPPAGPDVEERLLHVFQQKTRNLVRKAMRQGFVERVTDEDWAWGFLAATHAENIGALGGRAKPPEHFAALRAILPPEMRRLAVAMDGATPVAAMLTLSFNGVVEYFTPAIRVEHRPRQPLSFLILRGMAEAVQGGARAWNWGGTWFGQTTLHHFKAGFGATDRPYSYLVSASLEGLAAFRARRAELGGLFPFFYTYPYARLDDPA